MGSKDAVKKYRLRLFLNLKQLISTNENGVQLFCLGYKPTAYPDCSCTGEKTSRQTGGSSSSRATYRDRSGFVCMVHFTRVMRRLWISIQVMQLGWTQLPVLK